MSTEPLPKVGTDRELMIQVARLYHEEQLAKTEIANRLMVSRFKVARLLEGARASGIVRILIDESAQMENPLAVQLREVYGLTHSVVVPTPGPCSSEQQLWEVLGIATAKLLANVLTERDILGIGWGRTISACIPHLEPLPRCPVVQLSGMAGNANENSTEVVRQFAAITKGPAFPMYAPLLLPDRQTTEALKSNNHIAAAFTMHEHLSLALLAVGSWSPPNSQLRIMLKTSEIERLAPHRIQTEMGGILLDDEGRQVAPELGERVLAIDRKTLGRVPNVIGVAGGKTKQRAIRVALKARIINSLITDTNTAKYLLT